MGIYRISLVRFGQLSLCLLLASFAGIQASHADSTERFYENSSASPILPVLAQAQHTIDIEIYEMNDPLVLQAIQTAVLRKVLVRVIQDPDTVSNPCKVLSPIAKWDSAACQLQKKMVVFVRAHGGQYVPFNKMALCGQPGGHCWEHGKMLVIDRVRALISTGNFNTTNLCNKRENPVNCDRDYTVLTDDPAVVATLEAIFENDLRGVAYDLLTVMHSHGSPAKLTVSPFSFQPMTAFILSAKKTVQIQNQYLKDPELNAVIMEVAKRGVQVYINVSSFCSFGQTVGPDAVKVQATYSAFDQIPNIHTRIFTRKMLVGGVSGYLHAKTILVDSESAWVGSVNGSDTALNSNREFGIFLNEPSEVQKLARYMYADFVDPAGETWQESMSCANDPAPATQGSDGASSGYSFD
jgi:phosphatidylserine/phosphatidylglycerophosphate/cardiolipin synthase-like enzyme